MEANPRQQGRGRALMADARTSCASTRADRRCAVPVGDGRAGRERAARRPQPGLLRGAQQPAARLARDLARRSGGVRRFSRVLPRPRARAPVVGPGGRLEELPRAVAQRRLRAVLRGALRAEAARRARLRRHAAAVPPLGAASPTQGPVYLGYRLGHIKADRASSARSSTTRARRCCTCCAGCSATRRSSAALRRFYDEQQVPEGGHRRPRRAFEAESGRPLERFFERWIYGAAFPRVRYKRTIADGRGRPSASSSSATRSSTSVTVTLTYADGRTQDVVVPVTDSRVERTVSDDGAGRQVQVNRDSAALAEFEADLNRSGLGEASRPASTEVNRRDPRLARPARTARRRERTACRHARRSA